MRLISSFKLVLFLDGADFPVQDFLGLPLVGYCRKESLAIPGGVRSERAGIQGSWLVWRYFVPASDLVPVVSGACPGFFLCVKALSALVFLLSSLGPRRRPDARLWLGVRLVVLWVCGLTAVTADPLVVPAPSSYYLRLIPNRLSTERKRLGLDAVPTPGWVKGFLSFP